MKITLSQEEVARIVREHIEEKCGVQINCTYFAEFELHKFVTLECKEEGGV